MKPNFETAWKNIYKRVYSQALRLTGNPHDAADLVQNIAIRAAKNYKGFRNQSLFSTWVYRICMNCFLDDRKKKRNNTVLEDFIEDRRNSGERMVGTVVAKDAYRLLTQSLAAEHLEILTMYHINGDNYEEIARALDLPIGTVKSRLHRARLLSRRIITDAHELQVA